jgi:hypothetical protein
MNSGYVSYREEASEFWTSMMQEFGDEVGEFWVSNM